MPTDPSTPGTVHFAATVLVADGIIQAPAGDLPSSVLADGSGTGDGAAPRRSLAA